jgi:hypothetical protein
VQGAAAGFDRELVAKTLRMVGAEYERRSGTRQRMSFRQGGAPAS